MKAFDIAFMQSNKGHLASIKNGSLKRISVPDYLRINTVYFNSNRGAVNDLDFNEVAALVIDTHKLFDEFMARPAGDMLPGNISFMESNRDTLKSINEGQANVKNFKDFRRVMLTEFNPDYEDIDEMQEYKKVQLIKDCYRLYDSRNNAFNKQ